MRSVAVGLYSEFIYEIGTIVQVFFTHKKTFEVREENLSISLHFHSPSPSFNVVDMPLQLRAFPRAHR